MGEPIKCVEDIEVGKERKRRIFLNKRIYRAWIMDLEDGSFRVMTTNIFNKDVVIYNSKNSRRKQKNRHRSIHPILSQNRFKR